MQRVKRGELRAVHVRSGRRKGLRIEPPGPKKGCSRHVNQRKEQCVGESKQALTWIHGSVMAKPLGGVKDEEWLGIAVQRPFRRAGRQGLLVKVTSVKALTAPVLGPGPDGARFGSRYRPRWRSLGAGRQVQGNYGAKARRRPSAARNPSAHGQPFARCRVVRRPNERGGRARRCNGGVTWPKLWGHLGWSSGRAERSSGPGCEPSPPTPTGGVGPKTPRRHVRPAGALFQVPDDKLYFGMAAVVGLQGQGGAHPVGYEGVVGVIGEQGELGTGGGFTRRTMRRTSSAWPKGL